MNLKIPSHSQQIPMPTTFHRLLTTQPTHTKVPYPQEFRRLTDVSIVSSFSVVLRYHVLHSSFWMPLFFFGHYEVLFLFFIMALCSLYRDTMQSTFEQTLCSLIQTLWSLQRHYAVSLSIPQIRDIVRRRQDFWCSSSVYNFLFLIQDVTLSDNSRILNQLFYSF